MTNPREKRRSGPSPVSVIVSAFGGFLILLTMLSFQMRAGADPALKPSLTAEPPKTILKRRIIETRVVITDPPAPSDGSSSAGASPTAGATGQVAVSPPAPVARVAPVQAAPVAPPPPPAPVTRTS
jgi:hypothetical protein